MPGNVYSTICSYVERLNSKKIIASINYNKTPCLGVGLSNAGCLIKKANARDIAREKHKIYKLIRIMANYEIKPISMSARIARWLSFQEVTLHGTSRSKCPVKHTNQWSNREVHYRQVSFIEGQRKYLEWWVLQVSTKKYYSSWTIIKI